jgi:hypothetical protein
MNAADRARWLEPSPSIAIDGLGHAAPMHKIVIRDLRARFGDPEAYAAHCSCGWASDTRTGRLADRVARRDGLAHIEAQLPPYGHRHRAHSDISA